MRIKYSTRTLLVILTSAAIIVGVVAWWLRNLEQEKRDAVVRSKKIAEHQTLFTEINNYSRNLDPQLFAFIQNLPSYNKSARPENMAPVDWKHKTGFLTQNPGIDQWVIQTYDCQYSWPTKQKVLATANYQIAAGYSGNHFDPHEFNLKYVDTKENRLVCEFVEKLLTDKYNSKQLRVKHVRIVE